MSEMEELETRGQAFARIPADQRFTWELKPRRGRLLFAETPTFTPAAASSPF